MTDQTPRTEAGRRLIRELYDGDPYFMEQVIAIEAEAAAQARDGCERDYARGVTDGYQQAKREAAERVRALPASMRYDGVGPRVILEAVLAILTETER